MAERFNAPVLKTGDPQGSVGSNPTPSAKLIIQTSTEIDQSNVAPVYPERKLSIRWDPSSAACIGSAPPSWQAWIVSETAL